jgi:DNA-binding NarL/FixJ family response regulator
VRIAVVTSDAMSQVLLEEHIQALGHDLCGWASTLDEAIDLLGACLPDVVILDPYFDSTLIDPEWRDRLLRTASFRLVLIGVDPERDRDLVQRLEPSGIIGSPPSQGDLRDALTAV